MVLGGSIQKRPRSGLELLHYLSGQAETKT
jgi:hypothetical protein